MLQIFEIEHCDHNSNVEMLREQNHLQGHAQTFSPRSRNIHEFSCRVRRSGVEKDQLKSTVVRVRSLYQ